MACNHKFIRYLNLERIDFKPTTLIVGTFNPAWPQGNNAEWFYGRTHDEHGNRNNSFWDVLPRLFKNEPTLIDAGPVEWKQFCSRKEIAITDLISSIDDANPENPEHVDFMAGFADNVIADEFEEHILIDIISLLQNNPTIRKVYITNGVNGAFWNGIWNPINQYCITNNIVCSKLLTPSKNARFSMFAHNRNNPQNQFNMNTLNEYILMKWMEVWNTAPIIN
jgi:hypothetical protein